MKEKRNITGIKAVNDRIAALTARSQMERRNNKIQRRYIKRKQTLLALDKETGEVTEAPNLFEITDTGLAVQKFKEYNIVNEQAEAHILDRCTAEEYVKLRKMTHMIVDNTYLLYNKEIGLYHTKESLKKALNLNSSYFYKTINSLIKAFVLAKVINGAGTFFILNPTYLRKGPYKPSQLDKYFQNVDLSEGIPTIEITEVKTIS